MDFAGGGWWIIDDTGFPKKGRHSVGVARQYCCMLGKQDNCQVAVSISLVSNQGSLPVAWQLYLPEDWAADPERRTKAGVPEEVRFATKTQIALQQLRTLLAQGAPRHCVLADAGCGVDTAFRQALSDMGLLYAVGGHFCRRCLAARGPALAAQALQRHGSFARDAQAHAGASTGERQGAGTVPAEPGVAEHQLARGSQQNTQWPLRGRAGAPCWRQCMQGTLAPRAMAAHRVARKRRRAEQVRSVHTAAGK